MSILAITYWIFIFEWSISRRHAAGLPGLCVFCQNALTSTNSCFKLRTMISRNSFIESRPPRGPVGGGARRGATAAAAVGPGGGAPAEGPGEAPKDFTKPRQTLQSPDRLYKAPERQ